MSDAFERPEQEDQSGRTIGTYRLNRLLGRGGMGEVYEAVDTRLDRIIAIKLLRPELVQDEERRSRFEREAKALAALRHPSIVTIYSIETIEDVTLIAMELVAGIPLSELLKSEQVIGVDRVIELALPIADALAAAHKQGIVHRDVKPDNIIVGTKGEITVLDFGLAKLAGPGIDGLSSDEAKTQVERPTIEGRILGTVHYMSPEQAQGQEIAPSTDVFSLGVVIYEMATGSSPFEGDTTMSRISSILKDEPTQMNELDDRVPEALDRIVQRCLVKDADRRWQTATDVRNELEIVQCERAQVRTTKNAQLDQGAASHRDDGGRLGQFWLWRNGGWLALVLLVAMGIMFWLDDDRGGTPVVHEQLVTVDGRSDAVSIMAPDGYELLGVHISPDGRMLAMHTAMPEASGSTSAKQGITGFFHLRKMDGFQTRLVPSSKGAEIGRFSPDGSAFIFMVMPEMANRPMSMMRLDLTAEMPPVQIGTVLQSTMGVQTDDTVQNVPRGFCWLNQDTILTVTETPNIAVQVDARTGEETSRIELEFDGSQRVIRVLDAIDEDIVLLGTDRYTEGRYLQEVHWADLQSGATGLVAVRTCEARLTSTGSMLFTRGATVFEIEYDVAERTTTGAERPVLSGLRTPNTWSGAVFDLSSQGTIVYLPGGVQGAGRSIWRHGKTGTPRALPFSQSAFEEGIAVSGDGKTVLATTTDASDGMWSISKGTFEPPRLRSFVSVSDRDVFSPVLSYDGTRAAAMTHTSSPSRQTAMITFDPKNSGSLKEILRSTSQQLSPLALNTVADELLFTRAEMGDQVASLEVISLQEGAESRVLISEPAMYKGAAWSPDGRMVAYISSDTGQSEAYVASYSDRGLGRVQLASSGSVDAIGWTDEGVGLLGLRLIGDHIEYMRDVSLVGRGVSLGPLVATGRTLDKNEINFAVDLDGGIYAIRKGDDERSANRVQMITDWVSTLE